MIIWVFRLKTREERGGGLPKGERCLAGFVIPDRVHISRDHRFGVSTKKKECFEILGQGFIRKFTSYRIEM